jgi:uncharacterized membrane protein YuzA (DUF378 family)
MPDIDPERLTMALQEDAKDANEGFRAYLIVENNRLRDENAAISDLRVENERLKSQLATAFLADILLIVGAIGFGVLGVLGRDAFNGVFGTEYGNASHLICLTATCVTALIGLSLKVMGWLKK